ncbi:MAG TPA: hypothetical protein VJ874_05335, partial [Candidatus Thermoplasmatota archaeon]|nr:hypothetical protein [Candidatus Thermoplasmatota archaeon]
AATTYLEGEDDEGGLVAVVVMQAGGSVEAVVQQFFPSLAPPAEVKFHLEARTVVRPDVVPAFLPVAVDLGVGETLLAAGDDLEDFVVIPPAGGAIHHLGPYLYNATSSGRHILVASGQGDIRVYGPPGTTLKALLVQGHVGEPHPVTAGQDTAWDFTLEGVPLYVGVVVETADNVGGLFGAGQFHGNYDVTFELDGVEVLQAGETDCAVPVQCGLSVLGSSSWWYIGDYLDEHVKAGTYQATASFEPSNNMQVYEVAAFVVP